MVIACPVICEKRGLCTKRPPRKLSAYNEFTHRQVPHIMRTEKVSAQVALSKAAKLWHERKSQR